MTSRVLALLSAVLLLGLASTAAAQPNDSPSNPETKPAGPAAANEPTTPPRQEDAKLDAAPRTDGPQAPEAKPEALGTAQSNPAPASVDSRQPREPQDPRGSEGSAFPRSGVERTGLSGLSRPTSVVLGSALLVLVVLAFIALTRRSETVRAEREY